eukprot:scaffold172392_cov30-Tisochrysis_lutea.AAC.1
MSLCLLDMARASPWVVDSSRSYACLNGRAVIEATTSLSAVRAGRGAPTAGGGSTLVGGGWRCADGHLGACAASQPAEVLPDGGALAPARHSARCKGIRVDARVGGKEVGHVKRPCLLRARAEPVHRTCAVRGGGRWRCQRVRSRCCLRLCGCECGKLLE